MGRRRRMDERLRELYSTSFRFDAVEVEAIMLLRDVQPLLYCTRVLGSGPHYVTSEDIQITRRGTIYTTFWILIFLGALTEGIYLLSTDDGSEPRLLLLTAVRTGLSYVCLFTDVGLAHAWNFKLRLALSQLRMFDRETRYHDIRRGGTTHRKFVLLIAITLSFWILVGFATYCCEDRAKLFNAVTYGLVNVTISFQLLRFVGFVFLLLERYRYLGKLIFIPDDGKVVIVDQSCKQLRLQEVWWLHSCLANATETINNVYGAQLLLWIATMSFNTLSRLYTINESKSFPPLLMLRESMLVSACVANLLIVSIICHMTASQLQNSVEAATYFQLRRVYFFAGAGLIRVDLPLLLSIASGITAYLVILHTANTGSS